MDEIFFSRCLAKNEMYFARKIKMIHIAIVEDEQTERERIKEYLDFAAKQNGVQFRIYEYGGALPFIASYKPTFDIILMDIEMPGMDGMEAARQLRKIDKNVIIIFVTNMAGHALKGYEVEALDFIVKPVDKYSFALKMSRAIARTSKKNEYSIVINTGSRDLVSLPVYEIKYVEVVEHYVIFHTVGGEYQEYATMKSVEKKLKADSFVRCNRCYIVNMRYIDAISGDNVVLGEDLLAISRSQRKSFLDAFSKYVGGGK